MCTTRGIFIPAQVPHTTRPPCLAVAADLGVDPVVVEVFLVEILPAVHRRETEASCMFFMAGTDDTTIVLVTAVRTFLRPVYNVSTVTQVSTRCAQCTTTIAVVLFGQNVYNMADRGGWFHNSKPLRSGLQLFFNTYCVPLLPKCFTAIHPYVPLYRFW